MTHLVYPPRPDTQTHHAPPYTHTSILIRAVYYRHVYSFCMILAPSPRPMSNQNYLTYMLTPTTNSYTPFHTDHNFSFEHSVLGLTIGKNSQIIPYFFTENFNTFTCFVYIQRIDLLCRHTYTILVSYVCGFKADLHSFNKSPPKRSVLADMTNWRTI